MKTQRRQSWEPPFHSKGIQVFRLLAMLAGRLLILLTCNCVGLFYAATSSSLPYTSVGLYFCLHYYPSLHSHSFYLSAVTLPFCVYRSPCRGLRWSADLPIHHTLKRRVIQGHNTASDSDGLIVFQSLCGEQREGWERGGGAWGRL